MGWLPWGAPEKCLGLDDGEKWHLLFPLLTPGLSFPLQTGATATSNEQALTVSTRRRGPAAAVASCTHLGPSGRSVCRSGGEGFPMPPLATGSPGRMGQEGSPSTSTCSVSPDSTSGWERSQAAQKCPCWWFGFVLFNVKMCISTHFKPLQQLQEHGCKAGPSPLGSES